VTAVLKSIPPSATRDRALFTLLYETGMRVSEALGVQYADLELMCGNALQQDYDEPVGSFYICGGWAK